MKKFIKPIILIAAAAVILVCAGCSEKAELDLSQYVIVGFKGVNGYGEAKLNFDYVSLERDVLIRITPDLSESTDEEYLTNKHQTAEAVKALNLFESSISVKMDKYKELKNGDEIQAEITYDKKLAKKAHIKVEGQKQMKLKVSGLLEAVEVSPFGDEIFDDPEGIQLTFNGASPFADLIISNNLSFKSPEYYVTYEADKNTNLKNGDVITITAKLRGDAPLEYRMDETNYKYTVKGLDDKVMGMSQLSKQDREIVENKCRDIILKQFISKFDFTDVKGITDIVSTGGPGAEGFPTKLEVKNAVFLDDEYIKVGELLKSEKDITYVPIKLDFDFEGNWWMGKYSDEYFVKSYKDVYGYAVIRGLVTDTKGVLKNADEIQIDLPARLFENKDKLNKFLLDQYRIKPI